MPAFVFRRPLQQVLVPYQFANTQRVLPSLPSLPVAGTYVVTQPEGLRAAVADYSIPYGSRPTSNVLLGMVVHVTGERGAGWLDISSPFLGAIYAPNGAGLERQSNAPVMAFANQVMSPVQVGQDAMATSFSRERDRDRNRDWNRDRNYWWNRYTVQQYYPIALQPYYSLPFQYSASVPAPQIEMGYVGPGLYQVIAVSGLNVRPGPGLQYLSQGVLPQGSVVSVLQQNPINGWVQIDSPNVGFVFATYLKKLASANG